MEEQIKIPKGVKFVRKEFKEQTGVIVPPSDVTPVRITPQMPPSDGTTDNRTDEIVDGFKKEFEELENKINDIKDSRTYQESKNKLDELWKKVKDSSLNAAEEGKLWAIKWKLDRELRKKEGSGSGTTPDDVRDDLLTHFQPCRGFNQMGCNSNSIKSVQECLGFEKTGNFDRKLYNELGKYGWQNGFNDSDVTRVCDAIKKGVITPQPTQRPLTPEEKAKIEAQKRMEKFRTEFPQQTTLPTDIDNWG